MANPIDKVFLSLPKPVRERLWGKFIFALIFFAVFSFLLAVRIANAFEAPLTPMLIEWGIILVAAIAVNVYVGGDFIGQMQRLERKTEQIGEGVYDTDLSTPRIDEVGQFYEALATTRDNLVTHIEEAEAERRKVERLSEDAERLKNHLESKASEFGAVMEAASQGDLTQRLDPESESEAMEEIARNFNAMMDEIEQTVVDLRAFTDEVARGSTKATEGTAAAHVEAEEVNDRIEEIVSAARRQNRELQSAADEMNSMSSTIQQVAGVADQVATMSKQAAEEGDAARVTAEDAVSEMNHIRSRTEATVSEIAELQSVIDQIGDIANVIEGIAEQTNLLALNASIEAARTGTGGEGFAIVADEIKELATETQAATEEVTNRVQQIQSQTATVKERMKQTNMSVEEGMKTVGDGLDSLEDIVNLVKEVNAGVQDIDDVTDRQAKKSQAVVATVDEVATISHQTKMEAGDVIDAVERQERVLEDATHIVDQLASRTEQLREVADAFKTRESHNFSVDASVSSNTAATVSDDD